MDSQSNTPVSLTTTFTVRNAQTYFAISTRALPADILVIIFELLSACPTELYAPLICSHVCAYWRRVAVGAPFVWSYIDTLRGNTLTRMWLARSKRALLDVRLWENPLDGDLMKNTRHLRQPTRRTDHSTSDEVIQDVKDQSHRWKSLNVAFCTMRRTNQIMEFLGSLHDTLDLESLTIGPMGSTVVIVDEMSGGNSPLGHSLADLTTTQNLFRNLNVRSRALRIDTYPISPSSTLLSSYLTILEVSTGCYYNHHIDFEGWRAILSNTPNLVQLRLVSFRHQTFDARSSAALTDQSSIELSALERLELSGAFVLLTSLFTTSSFPKLDHLLLNSLDASDNLSLRLATIASRSPSLRQLSISSAGGWWIPAAEHLPLLQEVTFFEMGWDNIVTILTDFSALDNLARLRLERIWDMNMDYLTRLDAPFLYLPPIELINCRKAAPGICKCPNTSRCKSAGGSNYSDNSSFSRFSQLYGYPSSEETGSDESERSYGEDEGSRMGDWRKADSTVSG